MIGQDTICMKEGAMKSRWVGEGSSTGTLYDLA